MTIPNEPTGELREQVARWLSEQYGEHPVRSLIPWRTEADALLSGPLVPLLARVRDVEALHHDFHGWCAGCDFAWPCQTRRALDGER